MRSSTVNRRTWAFLWLCACAPVTAIAGDFGGSIGVTSDYIYRGISQSQGNAALQADLHYLAGGWSAGGWVSRADVNSDEGPATELDLYIRRDWSLGSDWDVGVALTHYTYPDDPRTYSYDYDEVTATAGYRSRLFGTIAYSPNYTGHAQGRWAFNENALSYELTAVQPLAGKLSASAGLGYYDLPAGLDADYWFWNVGVACSFGRALLSVAYIDTDRPGEGGYAYGYEPPDGQWTGSLAWRF
jgi:uncharacterized protein (TIGR02001 family)